MTHIISVEETNELKAGETTNVLTLRTTRGMSHLTLAKNTSRKFEIDLPIRTASGSIGGCQLVTSVFNPQDYVMVVEATTGLGNHEAQLMCASLSADGKSVIARIRFFEDTTFAEGEPLLVVRFVSGTVRFRAMPGSKGKRK